MEMSCKDTRRLLTILTVLITVLGLVVPAGLRVNAETDITIPVKVSFSGSNLPSETFTLELSGDSLELPLEESIDLSNGRKTGNIVFNLGKLPVGIYEYTLKEIKGGHADITYDQTEYSYYVMVNADGSVEQRAVNKADESDKPNPVEFKNSYRSSGKDKVIGDPPVKIRKVITGKTSEEASEFLFIMEDAGNTAGLESNPLPDGCDDGIAEVSITGEGEVEIGDIAFTKEGMYRYEVSEKNTKIKGYNYDDAVFDVTYTVTQDQSGKLVCEREILKNKKQRVKICEFENYYGGISSVIRRAVETGDPAFMVPLTALCTFVVALIAFLMTAGKRRRDRRG